ncbi:MAG: NifB/NifX family molybdenum-iron cluster-binding protein [Clostridiales bacterium]|nr:NifB/NifX family molybdenum-iron cluster-binding protein [Clostridiales bacterium]
MRVAVSYDNGNIFNHVGDAKEFKIYDIEDGKIVSTEVLKSSGSGRAMVVDFVSTHFCDVLICNEICSGAKGAVNEAGTKVYGAVTGNADDAVEKLIQNQLEDGDTVICHHD